MSEDWTHLHDLATVELPKETWQRTMEEKELQEAATQDDAWARDDPRFPELYDCTLVLILSLLTRLRGLGHHLQQQRDDYLEFAVRVLMWDFKELHTLVPRAKNMYHHHQVAHLNFSVLYDLKQQNKQTNKQIYFKFLGARPQISISVLKTWL